MVITFNTTESSNRGRHQCYIYRSVAGDLLSHPVQKLSLYTHNFVCVCATKMSGQAFVVFVHLESVSFLTFIFKIVTLCERVIHSSLCMYPCQCREHGSVRPVPGLCPRRSGSASSCPALSAAAQVCGAEEGPGDTSRDETARTSKPHQETP